jgi:thiamine-phosphate pyrophosphorylase
VNRALPRQTPLIYLITSGILTRENINEFEQNTLNLISEAATAGIQLVQIREKQLPARQLSEFVQRAAELIRGSETRLLVNDRVDIAVSSGADGVHLTENSIPASAVRRIFPDILVGVSCHSAEAVLDAKKNGGDFAVFGPVFDMPGKGPAAGLEALAKCCELAEPFPVLALGGVDASNYGSALKSGAAGFAAVRFLSDPENLRSLTAVDWTAAGYQIEF